MTKTLPPLLLLPTLSAAFACGGEPNASDLPFATSASSAEGSESSGLPDEDDSTSGASTTATSGASTDASGQTGSETSAGSESTAGGSTGDVPTQQTDARGWILEHFADAPVLSGDFDSRTLVEVPRLVFEATGGNAKYAFTPRNEEGPEGPDDMRVGFVDVSITDLVSHDAYGGGIGLANDHPDISVYLDEVYIEPNWPQWDDYQTTNYDGIVLNTSTEAYGEDVTIVNWNADSAIDNKADVSQFVRLVLEGAGNRAMRYWRDGPHYLVESSLENPDGTVLWFSSCDTTTLYVYDSTFNGNSEVLQSDIECDEGSTPNVVYLDEDPRQTGEMHPMFSWPVE